jgi:hypothetical protein
MWRLCIEEAAVQLTHYQEDPAMTKIRVHQVDSRTKASSHSFAGLQGHRSDSGADRAPVSQPSQARYDLSHVRIRQSPVAGAQAPSLSRVTPTPAALLQRKPKPRINRADATCPVYFTAYFLNTRESGGLHPNSVSAERDYPANSQLVSAISNFRDWVGRIARTALYILECLGDEAGFMRKRQLCRWIDLCRHYDERAQRVRSIRELNEWLMDARVTRGAIYNYAANQDCL